MNQGVSEQVMGLLNNPADARQQINMFAQSVNGDPKAIVQDLINSGQMSQTTYNTLSKVAQMFMRVL